MHLFNQPIQDVLSYSKNLYLPILPARAIIIICLICLHVFKILGSNEDTDSLEVMAHKEHEEFSKQKAHVGSEILKEVKEIDPFKLTDTITIIHNDTCVN